jgi:TM2 domain-containing membrane protein YozV
MGTSGPLFLLGGWIVLVLLLRRGARRVRGESAMSWRLLAAWTTVLVAVCGVVLRANGVGDTFVLVPFVTAVIVGGAAVALVLVVERYVRPRLPAIRPVRAPLAADRLTTAMVPMLVFVGALLALRFSRLGDGWHRMLSGLGAAGLLYMGTAPLLLPAAALVAWGVDRALGRRASWPGRLVAVAAALILLVATAVMPGAALAAGGHVEAATPMERAVAHHGLHGLFWFTTTNDDTAAFRRSPSQQFDTSVDAPEDTRFRLLPLRATFRAGSLLMVVCVALSLAWLARASLGVPVARLTAAALVLGAVVAAGWGAARLGPSGAPIGAALVVAAALLASVPPVFKVLLARRRQAVHRHDPATRPEDRAELVAAR